MLLSQTRNYDLPKLALSHCLICAGWTHGAGYRAVEGSDLVEELRENNAYEALALKANLI